MQASCLPSNLTFHKHAFTFLISTLCGSCYFHFPLRKMTQITPTGQWSQNCGPFDSPAEEVILSDVAQKMPCGDVSLLGTIFEVFL